MKAVAGILLIACFALAPAAALAQAGHEEEHPAPAMMQEKMTEMLQKMEKTGEMMHPHLPECRPAMHKPPTMAGRLDMMTRMLSGRMEMSPAMMKQMTDRIFFLDRAQELGLTPDQVERLGEIRAECRKDNIHTGAELKITLLELEDLLSGEWTVEEAEKLIRTARRLEGDIQVRHLKAVQEAHKVLTEEQLKKAEASEKESLEELLR